MSWWNFDGQRFSFDENPDRHDHDLGDRVRRALDEENSMNAADTGEVIADRAREAEATALSRWFKL